MRRFRLKRFEVYADTVKLSTLMSLKFVVAKLLSQTLRKSSSFRTLRRLHELAKLSTLTTLHSVKFIHDFATTLVMHQVSVSDVASLSPEFQWSRSCLTIWRTQNSSAARISSSESSSLFEIRHSNDPNTPRGVHLLVLGLGKTRFCISETPMDQFFTKMVMLAFVVL